MQLWQTTCAGTAATRLTDKINSQSKKKKKNACEGLQRVSEKAKPLKVNCNIAREHCIWPLPVFYKYIL